MINLAHSSGHAAVGAGLVLGSRRVQCPSIACYVRDSAARGALDAVRFGPTVAVGGRTGGDPLGTPNRPLVRRLTVEGRHVGSVRLNRAVADHAVRVRVLRSRVKGTTASDRRTPPHESHSQARLVPVVKPASRRHWCTPGSPRATDAALTRSYRRAVVPRDLRSRSLAWLSLPRSTTAGRWMAPFGSGARRGSEERLRRPETLTPQGLRPRTPISDRPSAGLISKTAPRA